MAAEPLFKEEELDELDLADESFLEDEAPLAHNDTEGVWLISYADLMTLLMGFFALMSAMANYDNQEFTKAADSAALYFGGDVVQPYEELGKSIEKLITDEGLGDEIQIKVSKNDLRITFEGTLFFASGGFKLKESASVLMNKLLEVLDKQAKDKKFVIEGHTDNVPIHRGIIASNWELSSLRANAVARLFETYGFKRTQILTIGLGDTRPILPNKDSQGRSIQSNQEQNRRVVITVTDKLPI